MTSKQGLVVDGESTPLSPQPPTTPESSSSSTRSPPRTLKFLQTWIIVNVLALISSVFVVIWIIIATDDDPLERPGAASAYLIWNVLTTIIWLVDTSRGFYWVYRHTNATNANANTNNSTTTLNSVINTLDTQRERIQQFFVDRSSTFLIIELTLAIYFTWKSLKLLYKWKLQKEDIETDLIEVSINVIAYTYICIITVLEYNYLKNDTLKTPQQQQEEEHDGLSSVNQGYQYTPTTTTANETPPNNVV